MTSVSILSKTLIQQHTNQSYFFFVGKSKLKLILKKTQLSRKQEPLMLFDDRPKQFQNSFKYVYNKYSSKIQVNSNKR